MSRGLLLPWCLDVTIINSGKFTLLLLSGCSFSCIKRGHRVISGNASSSTKISVMNLAMYSIRILTLKIKVKDIEEIGRGRCLVNMHM